MITGKLNISDADILTAADLIGNDLTLDSENVQFVLRSYISLTADKKSISDYGSVSVAVQNSIAQSVYNVAGVLSVNDVHDILNDLIIQGANGLINPYIVAPGKWETQQEQAQAVSEATSTPGTVAGETVGGSISDAVQGIFTSAGNGVKTLTNDLTQGLGINLQTLLIIAVLGSLVILYFRYGKAST